VLYLQISYTKSIQQDVLWFFVILTYYVVHADA